MNIEATNRSSNAESMALRRLLQLERQTELARGVLGHIQREIVQAGNQLGGPTSTLLEANEQLVLSSLRAQTDVESTAHTAAHDALTDLPNRILLLDRLVHAIAIAKRHGSRFALLFLDLNRFKEINDTLGHAVGDDVLKRVAHCLVSSVREADTVSRHGGDEFLILLAEISEVSDATRIAEKIVAALSTLEGLGDPSMSVTASIGISLYPEHGSDAETLIECADAAMYHAKRQGFDSCIYGDYQSCGKDNSVLPGFSGPTTLQLAAAEHERRHTELREANENLIVAVLNEQELRAVAEQNLQQQTEFLATIVHALRNPLGPIRSAASLLGRLGTAEPQVLQLQSIIERQVTHLSRLVGDLFDVSRAKVGELHLSREVLDMERVIDVAVDNCRPAMHLRHQSFNVQLPPDVFTMLGDEVRFTQILSNLLNNASQYTPEHGKLGLSLEIKDDLLVITVSDNGIGISADVLPHIFEPFVRGDHATRFNGDGSGIGLTVVRELVEGHGGNVIATSAGHGLGSQFIVTLPLA